MENFMAILIFIIFLGGLVFLNGLYLKFMGKLTQNNIKNRIAKGKLNDKKLIHFYKIADRNRNNKFLAFLSYGVFYRSFLDLNEEKYLLFKEEAERRGLINQI